MTLLYWQWYLIPRSLRSLSRASSQRLSILRKSCQVFHNRLLLGRCFRGFVLPVLECCSSVWCSAGDTHLRLLDCLVSGASFLTVGVFECDLAHRWSVSVLCMLYKIRCNPKNPLDRTSVHLAEIAYRYTYEPSRCRTSQYRRTFIPLSVSQWNDHSDPVLDGVGLVGSESRANDFLLA